MLKLSNIPDNLPLFQKKLSNYITQLNKTSGQEAADFKMIYDAIIMLIPDMITSQTKFENILFGDKFMNIIISSFGFDQDFSEMFDGYTPEERKNIKDAIYNDPGGVVARQMMFKLQDDWSDKIYGKKDGTIANTKNDIVTPVSRTSMPILKSGGKLSKLKAIRVLDPNDIDVLKIQDCLYKLNWFKMDEDRGNSATFGLILQASTKHGSYINENINPETSLAIYNVAVASIGYSQTGFTGGPTSAEYFTNFLNYGTSNGSGTKTPQPPYMTPRLKEHLINYITKYFLSGISPIFNVIIERYNSMTPISKIKSDMLNR